MQLKLIFFLTFVYSLSFANESKKFNQWKKSFVKKAASRGIPTSFLKSVMADVKFEPEVIEKDRNQITASSAIDYQVWIKSWLRENPSRIEMAKAALREHKKLLDKIEKKYHVEKEVIVALWGVESLFGKIQGDYDIVSSLSTLTFDGRRKNFFEIQLIAALRILYQGHVKRVNFKGSWAGATGQCQFMPSNIPGFAQDYDGDGKKDIWNNPADVFASIAYLLKKGGWKKGLSIGTLAKKTRDIDFNLKQYRTASQYNALGLKNIDGEVLSGTWKRIIDEIPMKNSPLVLRGGNYQALMKWNRSSLFAALNIILIDGLKEP